MKEGRKEQESGRKERHKENKNEREGGRHRKKITGKREGRIARRKDVR